MTRRFAFMSVLGLLAAMVVMPSAAAGGGCHPPAGAKMTSSNAATVLIDKCQFMDTVVYIEPGQEVRWTSRDYVPHTVTGAASSWGTDEFLNTDDEVAYKFAKAGVYPYYCVLHPSMVGAVVVGDATKAASLTRGKADVELIAAAPEGGEPIARETGTTPATPIGLMVAAAVALGLVLLGARLIGARRRSTATFTP